MIKELIYTLAAAQNDLTTTVNPLPNSGSDDAAKQLLPTALEILFGIVGAIAVLIIVINGFRYVLSAGDPSKMSQAKNGIIYAVIGLAIALSGFSIVAFVARGVA